MRTTTETFRSAFHQKANPVHNGIDLEVLEPRLALDGDGLTGHS